VCTYRATVLLAVAVLASVLASVPTAVVAQQVTLPPLRGYIGYDLHVLVYAPPEARVGSTVWVNVTVQSPSYGKYVYFLRTRVYGCGVDVEDYPLEEVWVEAGWALTSSYPVTPKSEGSLRVLVEAEYYFEYKGYYYYQYGFVAGNLTVVRSTTYQDLALEYLALYLRYLDLQSRYDQLLNDLTSLREQYEELSLRYQVLAHDYDRLSSTYRSLADMYGRLLEEHGALAESYSALRKSYESLQESYSALLAEHSRLAESYESLRASYTALQEEYGRLVGNYSRLLEEYGRYRELYEGLSRRYAELEDGYRDLLDSYRALLAESRELREEVASYQDLAQKLIIALLGLTATAVVLLVAVAVRVLRR